MLVLGLGVVLRIIAQRDIVGIGTQEGLKCSLDYLAILYLSVWQGSTGTLLT